MLKLEDIYIQGLKEELEIFYKITRNLSEEKSIERIYEMLDKNNIETYQQLKDFIKKHNQINIEDFIKIRKHLNKIITKLEKIPFSYEKPSAPTFTFDTYSNSKIDMLSLETTDKDTLCNRLIYLKPTNSYQSNKVRKFNTFSIYQAKNMLGMYGLSDDYKTIQNALIANIKNFGLKDAIKVKFAIDFYEEQVIRQAQEAELKEGINYFDLNMKEKELIIRDKYKEIIEYIVFNANTCVWGELTKAQKILMLKSIDGHTSDYEIIRNNFVNIFRDYTTLLELDNTNINPKVLQRFIVKQQDIDA